MIVVTAAGGQTGAAVVRALWSRGHRVRAVVSGARERPELTALAADVVSADLRDGAAMERAVAGAEALYVIWPNFDPGEAAGVTALLDVARRVGVGRVVYHSVLRPQIRVMPHHAAKDLAEEALDAGGLPWRVLQPCAYADNLDDQFAAAAASGLFRSPWGLTAAQSLVDLRDVAEAAVVLLTEDGLDGGTFEAVGPEPLPALRIAELMGRRLGREVTAVDAVPDGPVPPPADYAAHCGRLMFDHYRAHGFTGSPRVLETLLDRPARTFAEHLASLADPDAEES